MSRRLSRRSRPHAREEDCYEPSLREAAKRLLFGKWTESRLMSRKWLIVAASSVVVVALDSTGHPLSEGTLDYLQNVHIAFLSVQGGIDLAKAYLNKTDSEGEL